MATRADIVADIQAMIGTDPQASTTEIATLIQLRLDRIWDAWSWSRRSRDFTISTVAQVNSTSSDTVTATLASSIITSAGTPFTSAMVGRQIAIAGEPMYFFVNSFTSTAEIVLGDGEGNVVTWLAATDTEASWRVFQTLYALPTDGDTVVSLAGTNPVTEYDGGREALDVVDPYRMLTGSDPTDWLYAGEDSSSVRQVEIMPVPTAARLLRGQYLKGAPTLGALTVIPVSRAMLAYLACADVLNMLHAKTGDESYRNLALFYIREGDAATTESRLSDMERLSLPTTLGRASSRGNRGSDFYVNHQDWGE